ncbi:MAG: HAD family hydrolase [Bacteroidetes bacterium]|nr:HAD family hydrolase [Bacteroidota bacterium]
MLHKFLDYKHIIWDWNGTLLDDAWLCVEVMNGMLEKRELPKVSLDFYRSVFTFPVRDYYEKLGYDFTMESFEEVGMAFMVLYNQRQKECRLHPEVVNVLETFKQRGFGQSILSAREQNELLAETIDLGVNHYFDKIYGLDDHYAHGKTEVGLRLISDLGLPASSLLFIGDTRHDAEVACGIGIDCILIPNGHHSEERLRACSFPLIGSLNELITSL